MFHVWLEKALAQEVHAMAAMESRTSGRDITGTALVKEIVTASLAIYRRAGSLSSFKAMLRGLSAITHVEDRPSSQRDIDQIAEQERELYGPVKKPGERRGRNIDKRK